MKKPGIIICSRRDSKRLPYKVFRKIGGKPLIVHLIEYLLKSDIKVCLAIPKDEHHYYYKALGEVIFRKIKVYTGYPDCPFARMHNAAMVHKIDPIIRVTHDKIFLENDLIKKALRVYEEKKLDYLYSSWLVDGSGFEIISQKSMRQAFSEFGGNQNIEHISYAIKATLPKSHNFKEFDPIYRGKSFVRFLIDYESDLDFIKILYQRFGNQFPSLREAIKFACSNVSLNNINKLPKITIYTCAYNAERYIDDCILSVMSQNIFRDCEYIIIDDNSSDETLQRILEYSHEKNIIIKKNDENVGLASSSNIALDMSKGKYIIRLDADDVFIFPHSVDMLIKQLERRSDRDVIYPAYVDEKEGVVKHGRSRHHIGGSCFRSNAIKHIKFTDRLRGYEGLDFFERAKRKLKICYFPTPIFFYRYNTDSMSNLDTEERIKIKKKLDKGINGMKLL
jgi:spore coat polysaccharide biosynthesis protein SpsF (cytidylyltransferase family)